MLVTGSSGLIGGRLVERRSAQGDAVRGVDIAPATTTEVVADLVHDDLGPVFDGVATVVHCASLHAPHVGARPRSAFEAVNVDATRRVIAAAGRVGVERLVFLSTTSVYGDAFGAGRRAAWVDETLEPRPRDDYDVTKLAAEALVAAAHRSELSTITLRVARCFDEPWPDVLINRLYRGVDLRDVLDAIDRAATADLDDHHVLNIAGPRILERDDVDELFIDAPAVIARRWSGPELPVPIPTSIDRVYVSDRAADVLGYSPRYGVADLLGDGAA